MYDYSKLNGRIVEIFGTQGKFSEAMELSERSVSLKLNNRVPFSQNDIKKSVELLNIPIGEISDYFFCEKGSD